MTPELDPQRANYYQGLIGVLRWIVELGRIDIIVPIALLSRHLALMPRDSTIAHWYHYLCESHTSTVVLETPEYSGNVNFWL